MKFSQILVLAAAAVASATNPNSPMVRSSLAPNDITSATGKT